MNIGEKIQICRKNQNMSQEALGQALLVSRQTISLWETGQTLPTIDNLIRLKEIFGMSLDAIFGDESAAPKPDESYVYSPDPKDSARLRSVFERKRRLGFAILISALFIACVASGVFLGFGLIFGCSLGALFCVACAFAKFCASSKKAVAKSLNRFKNAVITYEIYPSYMDVKASENGEEAFTSKVAFDDIDSICDTGDFLVISHGGWLYPIPKSELPTTSLLYSVARVDSSFSPEALSRRLASTITTYLTVLSFASMFAALASVIIIAGKRGGFAANTPIFFAFTPIPVALTVYGLIMKIKKKLGLFPLFIGLFITAALCFYGSFSFIF
jgi:transcriptional regulator with XRE-family HTH domain